MTLRALCLSTLTLAGLAGCAAIALQTLVGGL